MKVSYEEIGHISATFTADSGEAGQLCKMAGNGKVAPCTDGDVFIGIIEGVRQGCAGVQIQGFAEVTYTGAAPALGYVNLSANGNGGVKTGSGREYLVVSVDSTAMTAIIKL